MKRFLLGFLVGIVLVPVVVILYLVSGRAPAATSDPPMPFEKLIAGIALHRRISREMPKSVPLQGNEATFREGARVYRRNCAICHGLPKEPAPIIGKGLFPRAPQLFQPNHMVTDDPPGETFWKAKHGIRLTGMPGFGGSLSDEQLWQVSLLLANADKLPASAEQELATASPEAYPSK